MTASSATPPGRWTSPGGDQAECPETNALFQQVYAELRSLARRQLRQERNARTLQPTALVNEVYLRLIGGRTVDWKSQAQFFAAAAEAMRRILVEAARARGRGKRGGGRRPGTLPDIAGATHSPGDDLPALDAALKDLARIDPRKAQLVELRYFGGLSEVTAAEVLGISRATASRWWTFSKAWLFARLRDSANEFRQD